MHELSPKGEKSFFKFYANNQEAVDGIINANIGRYVQPTDRDEIRQDLLLAFDRCEVLEGYASSKSAFNTYFTRVVRGYIGHWFDKQRHPTWRPYPSTEGCAEKSKFRFERAYYKAFNGLVNDDDDTVPMDVAVVPNIEDELSLEQSLACVREKLEESYDKSVVRIFDLLAEGNTNKEVAVMLKSDEANVSIKTGKIKIIAKTVSK